MLNKYLVDGVWMGSYLRGREVSWHQLNKLWNENSELKQAERKLIKVFTFKKILIVFERQRWPPEVTQHAVIPQSPAEFPG